MEEIRNQAQEAPNARAQAFLSLQNLEKVYPNGEKAVYNFNLDIRKNEFIVIVGPSGCGKSTTLRMLAGLEDISEGDIFMEGNSSTISLARTGVWRLCFKAMRCIRR